MVLIRLILLFIIIYLLIRVIGRVFFGTYRNPSNYSNGSYTNRKKREGEVFIDHQPGDRKKIIHKEDGEYVKFEEFKKE